MGEEEKHRSRVLEYCKDNTIDLGSSGTPIVPHAIQIDLPEKEYHIYNSTRPPVPIQWRGSALDLPFKNETVDALHASHLIEDWSDWGPPLKEWTRVLKRGGFLIIALPSRERFRRAVSNGQPDNLSHRRESAGPGELSHLLGASYEVIFDNFVNDSATEYSILFVGKKK